MPTIRDEAWKLFDEIILNASRPVLTNPWATKRDGSREYVPDYPTLCRLLGVPLLLQAGTQSGVPALAVDVWVSYEFRRAGFDPDLVWPRPVPPRVLPAEIVKLLEVLPKKLGNELRDRISKGGTAGSANANILGKNYVKQVDVGISAWSTGPELLVSTKRMDSSFGKNAANRVEESYGDAKNLRLRHPQAAIGFLYVLSSDALRLIDLSAWIIDLLGKLGREDDAYHAVGLLVPQHAVEQPSSPTVDVAVTDGVEAPAEAGVVPLQEGEDASDAPVDGEFVRRMLANLPTVRLIHEAVPAALSPARFLRALTLRVLDNSPINFHVPARRRFNEADGRSPAATPEVDSTGA